MLRARVEECIRNVLMLAVLGAAAAACAPEDGELVDGDPTGKADCSGHEATLSEELLAMGLGAAELAHSEGRGVGRSDVLTIVDFSLSSAHKRLWVIDTGTREVLFNERVAHGVNSGDVSYATEFSNVDGTHQSSLGLFEVNETGVGSSVGRYVAVDGLERGWNSNARARQILIHGASYASNDYYETNGYTGRSHGCFTVRPDIIRDIQDAISGGSLLFAYYPDEEYLRSSRYVTDAPSTPWIGDLCDRSGDEACAFSQGGTQGSCYQAGGFCVLPCEGICPDRYLHATAFCVESAQGGGMCVPRADEENHYCADLPRTTRQTRDRYVGSSGAAARSAEVCLPAE